MTPEQALQSATTTAAALLDKSSELGAVAPNFTADLAVVDGNPLTDIDVAIHHVVWVMKSGSIVVDKTSSIAH